MNRTMLFAPLAAVAAGTLLLASAGGASARTVPAKTVHPAQVAANQTPSAKSALPLSPATAYAKYQIVTSALLTDTAGAQSTGTVSCPSTRKLVGGGAVISSTSLSENLNTSIPLNDGLTWRVDVNNSSATNGTFRVYAVCVRAVPGYAYVTGTAVPNPAGAQNSATATCPIHTVPLGGGGFSSAGSTSVNLNTSIPLAKGWRVDMNNGSGSDATVTAYVVCGAKRTGYVQVAGTATIVNPASQASSSAACPTGTVALGGGAFSSSGSTAVELNSTFPSSSTTWQSYESNGSTGSNSVTAYVVCANGS